MELRVTRLEQAFEANQQLLQRMDGRFDRIDASLSEVRESQARLDGRFDRMDASLSEARVSHARLDERMERVLDRTREMPSESKINQMLDRKLTKVGVIFAIVIGLASLIVAAR